MSDSLISQDEIDTDAYSFVMTAKEHFTNMRVLAGYETEWDAYERSYNNDTISFYAGMSKVRIPALHNAVETIVPIIDKATFPPDGNFFDVVADDEENEVLVDQADRAKALLKDQFRDMQLRSKLIGPTRNLCIYGTLFIKTKWEHKIKTRYKRDSQNKRIAVWDTVFDNPDFYEVAIRDLYADIKDEDLEGLVIERIVKDYQDLWENRERQEDGENTGVYRNVESLKDVVYSSETDPNKIQSEYNKGLSFHKYGNHEHKVEIFECWGMIPKYLITRSLKDKEDKSFIDGFIVIGSGGANGRVGVTLRISDNPFDHQEKPYLRCRYIKVSGRLYGIGVMTVNIPLEAELNTRRQQTLDMQTKNLRPKWVVDANAEIDTNQLIDDDDQVIVSQTGIGGLQPLRPNDMTQSSLAAEANNKEDINSGTGAKPIMAGSPNNSSIDRTSVGVTTVVQSALSRIDLVGINYENELLIPLCRHMWMLDQQFLTQPREILVSGMGLIKVDPRDIPLPKINFTGIKEMGEKQFKINSLNILVQNLAPYAQLGIDPLPAIFEEIRLMGLGHLISQMDKRPDASQDTVESAIHDLQLGKQPKFNINDPHEEYIAAFTQLLQNKDLPGNVRQAAEEALGQRKMIIELLSNWSDFTTMIKNKKQGVKDAAGTAV